MAPEIKSKGAKTRRVSGQTLRLRKKQWALTGLKADRKFVGKSFQEKILFCFCHPRPYWDHLPD